MNKYRVRTTTGEWVYTEIQVLEDSIQCPLFTENGEPVGDSQIKLLPETLQQYTDDTVGDEGDKELVALADNLWEIFTILGNVFQNPELLGKFKNERVEDTSGNNTDS